MQRIGAKEIGARTSIGIEHRRESVSGTSDAASKNSEWLFGNFLPSSGENRVSEAFSEILLPLVEDKLAFNGAARIAKYSYSGSAFTWKAGLNWSPTESLLVRGVRSRDIRAPNLGDLYQAGLTQRQNINDPWFDNTRRNIERVSQGNLALKPELADTYSLGLVLTPTALPNFQGSLDYYHINIEDALVTVRNHAAALTALSPRADVLFDASFSPRLDYYTGVVFEMTGRRGEVLASGGEYDRLLDRLGATEPVAASGCALWTDRLEAELSE